MQKLYTDFDYDSIPVADLSADIHWIQIPAARWAPIQRQLQEKREQARLAHLPKEHKIILVPADPTYSPTETDLWPLVNVAVQKSLLPHPEILNTVCVAVSEVVAQYRGWRNPFPQTNGSQPN